MIEALLCSKVSQRRIAKILNIDKKTVHRKIIFLGIRAEEFNRSFREKFNESKIKKLQFDDLITKEKTKLLPLTVTGIVEPESRRILALEAGAIPAFGHLSKLSKKKYGWRKSEHKDSLKRAFEKIKSIVHDEAEIRSDEHKLYPDFIRSYFPISNYKRYSSIKSCIAGQGELKKSNRDPLYSINHTFAMMRDNINRLVRKSWCVTQDIQMLQHHLEIYIKFHNTKLV